MQVPLVGSPLVNQAPPGARKKPAPRLDTVTLSPAPAPSEERPRKLTWRHGLTAALMAAGAVAGIVGVTIPGGASVLERETVVQVRDGYGQYKFEQPIFDLRDRALKVTVELPPELRNQQGASVGIAVKDSAGAGQSTNWNAGLPVAENPNYDAEKGVLTILYDPSSAAESYQGKTDYGFDPQLLLHGVTLRVSAPVDAPVKIVDARIVPSEAQAVPDGVERPLLRPGAPRPLEVSELKHGVSTYIAFGDLHRFERVRPELEQTFANQQKNGLDSFRWMGGLDFRQTAGGIRVGERETEAMREALELADHYGQKNFMFTLLDGAIPNQTVQKAMRDPAARQELVEALRPFVHEFRDRGVIWDVVNEIHGVTDVTEHGRQALVNELVEMIATEAPNDTVTVGVQNFRELRHWTYLSEQYPDTKFLYTFHLYEDMKNVPNAWDLNVPPNAEVGITEADPARGMKGQIKAAADKGYSWMLFWEDARFDYTPEAHARALR